MISNSKTINLIPPFGNKLINLMVEPEQQEEMMGYAESLPSIPVSARVGYDLELLAIGAFSPLDRFMGKADYQRTLTEMRLANGILYPIPVTLPVDEQVLSSGVKAITLSNGSGQALAIVEIEEVFSYDKKREARLVLGTTDPIHPYVAEMAVCGKVCISGPLKVLDLPYHKSFGSLCKTPLQVRAYLQAMDVEKVVAFQTRNPMHRIHEELTKRAATGVGGALLLHPVVGQTKPGDIEQGIRTQIYQVLVERYYDPSCTLLSLLPLAMRFAGPREALWHAIIRRNYGATHMIIGRDHAGPGKDSRGEPFYEPYEAQLMFEQYAGEIGVQPLEFKELVYLAAENRYEELGKAPPGAQVFSISGTQVRDEYLAQGKLLPEWFSRPEVAEILYRAASAARAKK
jgi:sulfate adenylyltransferase